MYKINIKISSDRKVDMSSYAGGVTGESNVASLEFTVPKEYSSYNKYLDVFKESGEKLQTVVSLKDESEFSYILPGELCDNLNVYMQLVMKKGSVVFKSYRFAITFEEGINVTSRLEGEYRDSIEELFELKADKEAVAELSKALSDKVAAQVFYSEKQILESRINEKADAQETIDKLADKADISDVDAKLNLKADKSAVTAELTLKADKADVDGKLALKADKADVESALSLKVDKEEGKGLSSNDFTDKEKEKLLGIADGAEVNVQADWNENDKTSVSYIKNKPDINDTTIPLYTPSLTTLVTEGAVATFVSNYFLRKKDAPTKLSDLEDDTTKEKPIYYASEAGFAFIAAEAHDATAAQRAYCDIYDNDIVDTYATKEELSAAIGEALEADY